LWDWLRRLLGREKCEKTVRYDGRTISFSGIDVASAEFSLGEFKTEVQKVREASEAASILDDFQFQMCKICNSIGRDDQEWRTYNKLRVAAIVLITKFRLALEAVKANPTGNKNTLDKILDEFRHLDTIMSRILPKAVVQAVGVDETVPKEQLPPVDKKDVSEAIGIAELREDELDKFLDELK
jgi:hypothetical protein